MDIINVKLPTRGGFSPRGRTDEIILHHAEASCAGVKDINRWHIERGWAGIGYHYYIRKDGRVYRGRPEWAIGAHAKGHNSRAVGICCEGAYMTETMPAAQLASLRQLIRELMAKYPGAKLLRHCDVNSTDCPGKNFPWAAAQRYNADETTKKEDDEMLTYEQFEKYMDRYLGALAAKDPSAWAADAWRALENAGITDGTKPQAALTREQLAVMLMRLGLIGKGAK